MKQPVNKYTKYFTNDQQVKIGIKVADNKFIEVDGLVRFIEGDRITLELVGAETIEETAVDPGADVCVTTWADWALCRFSALLTHKIYGRRVFIQLIGPVIKKQAREYFRLDVSIPLCYTIPEKQHHPNVLEEWTATREFMLGLPGPVMQPCSEGFKLVRWNNQGGVMPQAINLSGGGMRFKTPEYVQPETLVAVSLFLPLVQPLVIHVVAETLRSNEIMLGRGRGASFINAMRFHLINDKDRETIIAFIFAEERRLLGGRTGKCL